MDIAINSQSFAANPAFTWFSVNPAHLIGQARTRSKFPPGMPRAFDATTVVYNVACIEDEPPRLRGNKYSADEIIH